MFRIGGFKKIFDYMVGIGCSKEYQSLNPHDKTCVAFVKGESTLW